jgi:hypothetical protein
MKFKSLISAILATVFTTSSFGPALADEGMWTFNNVPKNEIKKRYGFTVSDEWLRKVQLGSVRFNSGGSGSFISPDGLVLTNHHVASETLQKISTEQIDYLRKGFYAKGRGQEIQAPDLELNVLDSLEDVTARVNGAVKEGMATAEANAARRAAIAEIEKESTEKSGLRSDVVSLYQGGQYNLYRYKKYTDVRLVFAPEFEIAFFGGDPDNFNFPRYNLDMAIFRVYENGQPAKTPNYFKWSTSGAKAGELVFVSGHPGSTQRLNTVAHLEYLRDHGLPYTLKVLKTRRKALQTYGGLGEEQARRAHEDLLNIENSLKAYEGQYAGLKDKTIMAKKSAAEAALRKQVAANPKAGKEQQRAWEAIALGRGNFADYFKEHSMIANGAAFNSTLFAMARAIVRLVAESARPNAERLPEYTDARRSSLELQLYSPAPIYDDLEKITLANSLTFMRDELGATHEMVKKILAGKTPEARAAELVDGSKLKAVDDRKQLVNGGAKAIAESNDAMIVLARTVDEAARALQKRYETQVQANENANYSLIARAKFDAEGTRVYPDATFTLRLSYGAVKGYQENGRLVAPFTDFAGVFKRADKFGNKDPYKLPESWTSKKAQLNLQTPFNFVSTNDIIGGNSGSPVINKEGRIVGLAFDGNIHSTGGAYGFDAALNRCVSVSSQIILEGLRKIYGAKALADELERKS